jgi:peptidoglycan/xylan/chitin deacetylase (PgdA/CDA1 family)
MKMSALYEQKQIPILMYHSIADHAAPKFRPFVVSPALFADHMAYLRRAGYTSLTVTQFVNAREQLERMGERIVVITFDDGFADFYSAALPVLKDCGFIATLYVATAFVGGTSNWLWREGEDQRPMLTWEQLAEISARGIECGAHSQRHPQLDLLAPATAQEEIVGSKRILEDRLGKAVLSFAYPFGYHNAAVRRQVRAAGYTSACAVAYRMSSMTDDPFMLGRLLIDGDTSVETLDGLLTGRRFQTLKLRYLHVRSTIWQPVRRGAAAVAGRDIAVPYPRGRLAER